MQGLPGFLVLTLAFAASGAVVDNDHEDGHHPHGHHHRRGRHVAAQHHEEPPPLKAAVIKVPAATKPKDVVKAPVAAVAAVAPVVAPVAAVAAEATHSSSHDLVGKMKKIEERLAKQAEEARAVAKGHLLVNGPLPADFNERFSQAVGHSTDVDARKVQITETMPLEDNKNVIEVAFLAPPRVVKTVENEAADPESKLAKGNLRPYLVAKDDDEVPSGATSFTVHKAHKAQVHTEHRAAPHEESHEEVTPVQEKGIDIDTQMPYGDLEPFGREDTAQELTESSVKESDEMVDQLERAEVAEEKRSVFRALTRLRGAAITSFDGVARSQTGNIDEYNKVHKWRKTHPLHHLADEESDVTKWAFPDNADFIQTVKKGISQK